MYPQSVHLTSLSLLALLASSLAAQSSSVTGRLQSASGAPIAGVTVHVATTTITTTSSATGTFTLTGMGNNRNADIEVVTYGTWAPTTFRVRPNGALNVGNVTLAPGALITGTVVGSGGFNPAGGNLNAYDFVGTKLFTPNDAISATGTFAITVPLGYNIIRAVPPVGSPLIPAEWKYTNVTGPITLPTTTMLRGYPMTMTVVDDVSGVPINGITIQVTDAITGALISQVNDVTNAFGAASLLVPFSVLDLFLDPSTGDAHMPTMLYGLISTPGPNALGQVRIKRAVTVSGGLLGPAGGVANADMDAYTPDGFKMFTPKDNTSATGLFSVRVPAGSTRFTAQPPIASGLVGADIGYVNVAALTPIPNLTTQAGNLITGTVTGPNGPEANANLNVYDMATGTLQIVTGDHTDAAGNYSMVLPNGNWRILVSSAPGSQGKPYVCDNVLVAGPMIQNFVLPAKTMVTRVTSIATLTVAQGGYLPINLLVHNLQPTSLPALIEVVIQYPSGLEQAVFPRFPIDLFPQFPLLLGPIFMPVPPVPTTELDRPIRYLVRFIDPATMTILDESFTNFVVH